MSAEENKAKVRGFYERAVNAGDLSAVDELVGTPEIIHASGGGVGENTPALVRKWVIDLRAAFPDIQVTVEDFIAEGDKLVNRVTYRGTHTGEFMGAPPTGKKFEAETMVIYRLANGKIVETWGLNDVQAVMMQLGLMPAPGQPAK